MQNIPTVSFLSSNISMTSKEIAELVDSRHDSVKRTVERLAKSRVIQLPPLVEVRENQSLSPNNKSSAYIFSGEQGKRDSIIVVAQLSPEFTARLVDRWQELETKVVHSAFAIPQTFSEALRLAADLSEQKIELEHKVDILTPKAGIADRIENSDGLFSFRQVAKVLNVKEHKLRDWLQSHDWMYYLGKRMTGKHKAIQKGYIVERVKLIHIVGDEDEKSIKEMFFTASGVHRLADEFNRQPELEVAA